LTAGTGNAIGNAESHGKVRLHISQGAY